MEHSSTITDTVPVANSFLTWPGEIHNQIYAELVPRDLMVCDNNWTADLMCPIHLNRRKPGCPQDWNKTWHNSAYRREFYRKYSLAMSGTCRQIRTEVLSVLPGSVCLTMCFWCRGIHLYQYGLQPYLPLVRKLVINGFNEESGTAWRELIGELPALEEFTFAIAALAHSKLVCVVDLLSRRTHGVCDSVLHCSCGQANSCRYCAGTERHVR